MPKIRLKGKRITRKINASKPSTKEMMALMLLGCFTAVLVSFMACRSFAFLTHVNVNFIVTRPCSKNNQ
jgi:hypothetical protein